MNGKLWAAGVLDFEDRRETFQEAKVVFVCYDTPSIFLPSENSNSSHFYAAPSSDDRFPECRYNIITKGYLWDNSVQVKTAGNKASFLSLVKSIQAIHSYASTTETKSTASKICHFINKKNGYEGDCSEG